MTATAEAQAAGIWMQPNTEISYTSDLNLHNSRLGLAEIDAPLGEFARFRRILSVRLRAQGMKRLSQAREREKEMLHTRNFE